MTQTFLGEHFLLSNSTAQKLYFDYAKACPIIDFHSHLPPNDIASDRQFEDLTELWLEGDHYKWRAMRANGISEDYITGTKSNFEKFKAWAKTVPYTIRNPLYHWTHLELQRYFDITDILAPETATKVFQEANERIATPDYSVRSLLQMMNVQISCTTDDPSDDLSPHREVKEESFGIQMLPTWRPDALLKIDDPDAFMKYLGKLGLMEDQEITSFKEYLDVIKKRHDHFHQMGCKVADHGLDRFVYSDFTIQAMSNVFDRICQGKKVSQEESDLFKSGMLHMLATMNHEKGWVQQYHVGAIRNTNSRGLRTLGPDTGFDSIGTSQRAEEMASFLGRLDDTNQLAPTILYNNNPSDNYLFATMVGNFQDGSKPGKMQFGASWWFLDQKEGIEMQLNTLSNIGLLSRFVGMVTDSRSFLSFPRHEYFRRILCSILGKEIEEGLIPNDLEFIGDMIQDICYRNALDYFNFKIS